MTRHLKLGSVPAPAQPGSRRTVSSVPRGKVLGRRARTRLHPQRHQAGVAVSRLLGRALTRATSSAAVGAALDVDESMVRRWTDERETDAFTLRDLVACFVRGERRFARAVLEELHAVLLVAESVLDARCESMAAEPIQPWLESELVRALEAKAKREGRVEAFREVHRELRALGLEYPEGREFIALCEAARRVLMKLRNEEQLEAGGGGG